MQVDRDTDRRSRVGDGPAQRLPDPPCRVGGEFQTSATIKLADSVHEAQDSVLDKIFVFQPLIAPTRHEAVDESQIVQNERVAGAAARIVDGDTRERGVIWLFIKVIMSAAQQEPQAHFLLGRE
ncbi:hypothetical protein GCM10018953_17810 [Streptosporangium nondiastaticum]